MTRTTSSSSAPDAPARRPRCCSPARASTSPSSTEPTCPATPCRPMRSPAAASCSSPGGACSTTSSPAAHRRSASASFVLPDARIDRQLKVRAGFDFVLAPRRYILDAILLRAAEEAGATVRTGVSVTGTVTDPSGRVTGVALRDRADRTSVLSARLVVGADGLRSRVARSVGAEDRRGAPGGLARPRTPTSPGSTPTGFEFHVGDRSFAGVFPTHDGEANVWMCLPGDRARVARRRPGERLPLAARGGVAVPRRARRGGPDHGTDPHRPRPAEPRPPGGRPRMGARGRRRRPP